MMFLKWWVRRDIIVVAFYPWRLSCRLASYAFRREL